MSLAVFTLTAPQPSYSGPVFFKQGVALPRGVFSAHDSLAVLIGNSVGDSAFTQVTALWHDGSIKWLLVTGVTELIDGESKTVSLEKTQAKSGLTPLPVSHQQNQLIIGHDRALTIATDAFLSLRLHSDATLYLEALLPDPQHVTLDSIAYKVCENAQHASAVKVEQQGSIHFGNKTLNLIASLTYFPAHQCAVCDMTMVNPQAASHPGGKWDLGDPNSIFVKQLGIKLEATGIALSINGDPPRLYPSDNGTITLHQGSSGKPNWNSPVHVNQHNQVDLPFKGFVVTDNQQPIESGEHSTPHVQYQAGEKQWVLEPTRFWQLFPGSVDATCNSARVSLLGSAHSPLQELQPGEQITRCFNLSPKRLHSAHIQLNQELITASQAIAFLSHHTDPVLSGLIKMGIEGERSFFVKRDELDEYGWRHFGELYADHEKALTPDADYFVSHYNNQYDPVSGMLRQYLITGDSRWFELANDLARHVANIDVYHTEFDKPEYSGGMFWHTDHYVQAYTATHRTYSSRQPSEVYEGHAGGGGPGGQHCYTHGLMLHYFLTGCEASKQAALSVCDWIIRYYEGDNTLVGLLLGIKNSRKVGLKNRLTNTYPLDRGTGNYLQSLLDRFELLGNQADLNTCAHIICHTISDRDDIQARSFDNIEGTWFYTVFLQAVCRFISLKEQRQQNDEGYAKAVRALKHYACWMANNEYAYLDKPEVLEFPNHTWTGQDLRKLCVLAFAKAYLNAQEAGQAQAKFDQLHRVIVQRLKDTDESGTTRLLCLMMQNGNYMSYADAPMPMPINAEYAPLDYLTGQGIVKQFVSTLRAFSLSTERRQLVKRFPQFQKWLGKP